MAITITQDTKQAWEKAIEKAKAIKPKVHIEGHGVFKVCGSKKDCYIVTWKAIKGQAPVAECSCPAGRGNKPCYHIPPTASLFKQQLAAKVAERVCCECGDITGNVPASDDTDLCLYCIECANLAKDEQDLFS